MNPETLLALIVGFAASVVLMDSAPNQPCAQVNPRPAGVMHAPTPTVDLRAVCERFESVQQWKRCI